MPAPSSPLKTILQVVLLNGLQSCRRITPDVINVKYIYKTAWRDMPEDLSIHIHRNEDLKWNDSSADGDITVHIAVHTEICMPTGCNIATQTAHLYVVRF
jgi:hypothetical protein